MIGRLTESKMIAKFLIEMKGLMNLLGNLQQILRLLTLSTVQN